MERGAIIGLCLATLLAGAALAQETVYNNAVTDLNKFYAPGLEFGDEVILESSLGPVESCTLTSLTFEYVGRNFSGDEQARLRFYLNDGAPVGTAARQPGTLLYDSGAFNIMGSVIGMAYEKGGLCVRNVPGHFTWTVQFLGITGSESAGLSVYSPPDLGSGYDDYWERSGNDWLLKEIPGIPMNFGAIIWATDVVVAEFNLVRLKMVSVAPGESLLEIRAPASYHGVIETSPDLARWELLTNWVSGAAPALVYDRRADRCTFYRAKAVKP